MRGKTILSIKVLKGYTKLIFILYNPSTQLFKKSFFVVKFQLCKLFRFCHLIFSPDGSEKKKLPKFSDSMLYKLKKLTLCGLRCEYEHIIYCTLKKNLTC